MSEKFINPYNFIPISKEAPQRGKVERGGYSGVISYSLLTKTPLFIPNTSNDDAFRMGVADHKSYDFFSYNDLSNEDTSVEDSYYEPVIPGSEIRGMIRSNYEILTNSCLSAVEDDMVLSKRTNETFKPGLLKKVDNEKYELHAADDCLMRTKGANSLEDDWKSDSEHYSRKCYVQDSLKEGEKVYFDYVKRESRGNNGVLIKSKALAMNVTKEHIKGKTCGYVIKGEDGPEAKKKGTNITEKNQKHCCHIFVLQKMIIKSGLKLNILENVLKAYKDNGTHLYSEYNTQLDKFMKSTNSEEYFPVYYSFAGDNKEYVMLSPACITREVYKAKLGELLKEHNTCADKKSVCPACALFGMLYKGNNHNKAWQLTSRLRFADMYLGEEHRKNFKLEPQSVYMKKRTLPELSSPKLNNTEFYLSRPDDAWFWTYDYYVDKQGKVHFESPKLNGRKFYWHNMSPDTVECNASNLNVTVRPIREGIIFRGKLYFDNVTKEELDGIIYTLECGDAESIDTKRHGYKLGHAKPLGYGSVAITVDSVRLRDYSLDDGNRTICIQDKDYVDYGIPGFAEDIVRDYAIMTDFDAVNGENIAYPIPDTPESDGSRPVYKWFVENHKGYDHKRNRNIGMPNSRNQMVYVEYMAAMEPRLRSTGYNPSDSTSRVTGPRTERRISNYSDGTSQKNKSNNKACKVRITNYNENRTVAYFRTEDNVRGSLYFKDVCGAKYGKIDEALPLGLEVQVERLGKNADGYVKWKIISNDNN